MKDFELTSEQVQFYRANGYLIVEGVVSPGDCEQGIAIFEKYAKPDFRGIMNADRGRIEYEGEDGVVEVVEVASKDARFIRNMMKYPKIVRILETLQGAEVWGLQTMFLFKKAGSDYAEQAWNVHQDNAYPQADPGLYLTGNIPFADQDPENGGMFIFPGSHQEPLLTFEAVKSFHEGKGQKPGHKVEVPPQYPNVDLYMRKGSVLILHGHVIHGSYPNRSHRDRPMLLIPYITAGSSFIPGRVAKRTPISLHD